ncbi:hypothetical protein, partial [Acinetobacter baumannii]|uniref:hypothetical protein n=1 Tax=Acinetobacter baumannii TaxID=470 RepID=UPI001BC89A0E
ISPTTEMHISGQINWQTNHAYLSQLTRLQSDTIAEAIEVNHLYNAFEGNSKVSCDITHACC